MIKKFLAVFTAAMSLSCAANAEINPTLKYSNAGTYEGWTEEAYYSAPAVCDLDGDGKKEIIFSNYSITVLDAETGKTKWKVNSGHDRTEEVSEFGKSVGMTPGDVEICDIDSDGKYEIITGHGGGVISVLSSDGYFKPGWPQRPRTEPVRSVEVYDLDGDGKSEIVAGYGAGDSSNVLYVFNCDGSVREGWPQLSEQKGDGTWLYGMFMDTIAVDDLNGDGMAEIIVPSDLSFISVFEPDGTPFPASREVFGGRNWGEVALYEDYEAEIRGDNGGWGSPITGNETREELNKGEFGQAKAKVCDVDGDGKKEIIVSTIMCNRKYAPVYPPSEYMTVAILNPDRTRFRNDEKGYNWEKLPMDLGKPLVQDSGHISSGVFQSPTVSDIDGDGQCEILFNSYNGKVHCFSLDRKEHYAWPFSLTKRSSPQFEYASPVNCVDLDGDGKKEVVFASSFDEKQDYGNVRGSLYILNYEGKFISKTPLPEAKEKVQPNGSRAGLVIDDIDSDGLYEIVINTTHGAICVYDL